MTPAVERGDAEERGLGFATVLAIALLAASIMLYELVLTRIFSFTIWHHFAFMVLSVALLGYAASGVAAQLRPLSGGRALGRAARAALMFALTAVLAVAVVTQLPFDAKEVVQQPRQWLYLLGYYACLLVPFACAGLATVSILGAFPKRVGLLYGSDLVGAGSGCLLVVAAMHQLGAEGVVLLVAVLAAVSAWLLQWGSPGHWRWLAAAAVFAIAVPSGRMLLPIHPGAGKSLQTWLDPTHFPNARLVSTQWDALSRVDVVEGAGTVRWTRHPGRPQIQVPQTQIIIDGDAATPIVMVGDGDADLSFLDYTLSSAALQRMRPQRTLVIGAGGGVDVLTALHNGALHVDAVEINPMIADLMTGRYAAASGGVLLRPEVTLHIAEGRSFLRRAQTRYDLIQLSLIDTWAAAGAGAYSLSESYLYTVEAFQDYLDHLSDGGVLTMTRWRQDPPREALKVCSVAIAALQRLGVERPRDHIVVLGLGSLANVLVKRTPFTAAELDAWWQLAAARQFEVLFAADAQGGDNDFTRFLSASVPQAFVAAYPDDLTPPTDDSPFFFQFGRWRDAMPWSSAWGDRPASLAARLVLLAVLLQSLVLAFVLLVLPMIGRARRPPQAMLTAAYFFLIGVSFMLLEVALMQRFTLFLGHPIYALTLVLSILLIAAGIGSGLAGHAASTPRHLVVFAGIVAGVVAHAWLMPLLFGATLGSALAVRLLVAAVSIFPVGVALGIPFPAAMARVGGGGANGVMGWAWTANGLGSVIGPILAVMLALDFGFSMVLCTAAVGYAAAYLCLRKL